MSGTDLLDPIKIALADRYLVDREIGRGGMAIVYLAEDLKHNRKVAIKVLRPELASAMASQRFLFEIATSARLQHPHIVPVYDSGAVDDLLFFVMPYIEGESLRDHLARHGPLPMPDAARILREVALALDYAHSRGVAHRDIKPANILLADGLAMVADFGIARALNASGTERMTQSGSFIGTPVYMSPESTRDESVDSAVSDQYSLACVMFEMLVGTPPFTGATPAVIMAKHSSAPVPSIRQTRPNIHRDVDAVISRALAKAPAERFPKIIDFSEAIDAAVTQSSAFPRRRRRPSRTAVAASVIGALAFGISGVALWRSASQRKAANQVTQSGSLAAGIPARGSGPPRLAVIRFDNLGEARDSLFAKGIVDELTSRVAELNGVDVISRMSAMQYDRNTTIAQLARDLSVDYVLAGGITTERAADGSGSTRVMPELIRVSDGRVIWRGTQEAAIAPGDLLKAQAAIAAGVAGALRLAFVPERIAGRVPPTTDRAAYEEFLNGNVYASTPRAEEPTRRAIGAYERATRADPNFALAYAKLAQTQSMYYAMNFSHPDVPAPRERAKVALDRAWSLDSTLPAVRMARGFYGYWVLRNNDTAMVHLAAARAADTSNTEMLSVLGEVLRSQGKWNEALVVTRRAADLDPRSQHYAFDVGVSAAWMGRYEEADRYLQKAIAIAPDWPTPYIPRAYVHICWKGDTARALSIMREAATKIDTTKIFVELISNYREDIAVLDPAWQDALARLHLRGLPVDSGRFYLAKAELFDRKHNASLARTYFDSARAVFELRNRGIRAQPIVDPLLHAELGLAYAGVGRAEQAVAEGKLGLQQMPASRNETAHAYLAMTLVEIYIVLKQYDAAIDLLGSDSTTKFLAPAPALRTYPFFAALRPHPRFQALIRRLE